MDSLWYLSVAEIAKGYYFNNDDNCYHCIICDTCYEDGVIYPCNEQYFTAPKMIKQHIEQMHQGIFDYLIMLDKQYNGISDNPVFES